MRFLALLALLQLGATPRTAGKSHGVIHDTMLEGVTFQEYGQGSGEGAPAPPGSLLLEPASLEFGQRPLGAAHAERVTLHNRSNSTLRLASISGSTHNFHASFFESKMVPPASNTSFSVVFLGRREGAVDSHLYLHTSLGSHKYAVSGVGVMSEYRLSPLVGVKLPRNTSFSPTIYMHNPRAHPIQVTEVYSSGGGVALELPDGGTEGPQSLWLLPAHTTRALVRLHYTPQHPHPPHTAYIRIKLNGTSPVLVVPVDVGVERDAGPYVRPHAVDAGLAGSRDPPAQIHLAIGNSGDSWVRLRHASLWREGDEDSAPPVDVELLQNSVPPHSLPAHAATLHVYWDRIYESGATYGEVRLTTAEHCLTVPYQAHALPGALVYNDTQLSFVTSTHDAMAARELLVRNEFASALHVTDVELSDAVREHFILSGFAPRSLAAGATVALFSLRPRVLNASLTLASHVTIVSNVTSYRVAVYHYSGRLEPEWEWPNSAGGTLDLGAVPTSSTTQVRGAVYNGNPVPVCVLAWGADMEGAALQFLGCPARQLNPTSCSCILPGEIGSLSLSVVAPVREGPVRGSVWLQTNHSRLLVAVKLRAVIGRLTVSPLHLDDCFPGTVCSDALRVDSSMAFRMQLLNVTPDPPDARLYHRITDGDGSSDVAAMSAGERGRVYFAAGETCRPCYTSVRFDTKDSKELELWLDRPRKEEDWLSHDLALLDNHRQIFKNLTSRHMERNLTLRLHTSEVLNHLITGTARWVWPRLRSDDDPANAGLVGVGGSGHFNVTVFNPSVSEDVYVQFVLASGPMNRVPTKMRDECERTGCVWSPRSFRVSAVHRGGATVVRDGTEPALLVPPRASAEVQLHFTPHSSVQHASVLFLRNNLTILDVVRLTGRGAYPSFKFGNRKPGSGTPLLFELTEKHLKDCDRDRTRLAVPPNLTVKRSFTARNTGDIPITVSTFYINGFECEGYGFKVLNCGEFELNPNATHKVDIAFTPDFTLSKIKRTLILMSSLSAPVNYSLVTTVPAHLLAPCSEALTRPPWETYVRNVVVSFMTCIGLCVLAAGFMESDRILKMANAVMTRNSPVQPPLDLRNIGQSKPWEWSIPPDRHKKQMWNDEARLEEKNSKYEELVPQKNKKKMSKKYSNEPAMHEVPLEKDAAKGNKEEEWSGKKERVTYIETTVDNKSEDGGNSTPPGKTRDKTPLVTGSEMPESSKKRHAKNERRQTRCEEDASSTATESSNNDEPEKEQVTQVRASVERNISKKSSPANTKKKCPAQYKDSYEGDGEDEEYDRPNKPNAQQSFPGVPLKFSRNKDNNTPTPTRQASKSKSSHETKFDSLPEPVHQNKPKVTNHKSINNKKEKGSKKKNDKVAFTVRIDNTTATNPSRYSPPAMAAPTSRWGENRATFSDVVSRSETSTFSTIVAPKKPERLDAKPKQTPGLSTFVKKEKVPLGPIGSNFLQKHSPTCRSEGSSLFSNPIRQITDPSVKFEDLVPADNNNSFFYFGTDNVRSSEILPQREVGIIGKPSCSTFPASIGQNYGQVSYSQSVQEGGRMIGDRMEFDNGWEQQTGSPKKTVPPNISQASPFTRGVYSGDTTAFNDLWDTPTTIASKVGAVGQASNSPAQQQASDQWLWYNGVRPPPGFPPQQQPISRQFDPFQSMSSIWSPVTQDAWSGRSDDRQHP